MTKNKNKEEGQKVVFEALDSKSCFSSILETFTPFSNNWNNVYFISVHCRDHSTYTVHNMELESKVIRELTLLQ